MQKHVNLVDLVKSFPTNSFLQNLESIQKRTSPIKFAHLAEKSDKNSISNLSSKPEALPRRRGGERRCELPGDQRRVVSRHARAPVAAISSGPLIVRNLRTPVNNFE